ncbi:hypothetical protein PR048_019248 [Dryococelus australis]|uniref:Uncharacterized protein n=1 Tax=Dryococelus australis TaxID=614101 RepID=A0ABQ9H315_9NEOP|nr:hypothetical protein PR048_019248 [Dryococelus australis]
MRRAGVAALQTLLICDKWPRVNRARSWGCFTRVPIQPGETLLYATPPTFATRPQGLPLTAPIHHTAVFYNSPPDGAGLAIETSVKNDVSSYFVWGCACRRVLLCEYSNSSPLYSCPTENGEQKVSAIRGLFLKTILLDKRNRKSAAKRRFRNLGHGGSGRAKLSSGAEKNLPATPPVNGGGFPENSSRPVTPQDYWDFCPGCSVSLRTHGSLATPARRGTTSVLKPACPRTYSNRPTTTRQPHISAANWLPTANHQDCFPADLTYIFKARLHHARGRVGNEMLNSDKISYRLFTVNASGFRLWLGGSAGNRSPSWIPDFPLCQSGHANAILDYPILVASVAPGFSHVGFVPENAAGQRFFFYGDLSFLPTLHSCTAPYSPRFTLIDSQDLDISVQGSQDGHVPAILEYTRELRYAARAEKRLTESAAGNGSTSRILQLCDIVRQSTTTAFCSPLVDDRPIMNAIKYRAVSGVVQTNRTMARSNTYTNKTGVLAVVNAQDEHRANKRLARKQGTNPMPQGPSTQPQLTTNRSTSLRVGMGWRRCWRVKPTANHSTPPKGMEWVGGRDVTLWPITARAYIKPGIQINIRRYRQGIFQMFVPNGLIHPEPATTPRSQHEWQEVIAGLAPPNSQQLSAHECGALSLWPTSRGGAVGWCDTDLGCREALGSNPGKAPEKLEVKGLHMMTPEGDLLLGLFAAAGRLLSVEVGLVRRHQLAVDAIATTTPLRGRRRLQGYGDARAGSNLQEGRRCYPRLTHRQLVHHHLAHPPPPSTTPATRGWVRPAARTAQRLDRTDYVSPSEAPPRLLRLSFLSLQSLSSPHCLGVFLPFTRGSLPPSPSLPHPREEDEKGSAGGGKGKKPQPLEVFRRKQGASSRRRVNQSGGVYGFLPSNGAPVEPEVVRCGGSDIDCDAGCSFAWKLGQRAHESANRLYSRTQKVGCNGLVAARKEKTFGRLLTARTSELMREIEVSTERRRNEGTGEAGDPPRRPAGQRHRPARFPHVKVRWPGRELNPVCLGRRRRIDGNTACLAHRSDEALGVHVSAVRMTSLLVCHDRSSSIVFSSVHTALTSSHNLRRHTSSSPMSLAAPDFSPLTVLQPERYRPRQFTRHDGNTARFAHRSDEALEVRVSVARIAPSLLDFGRPVRVKRGGNGAAPGMQGRGKKLAFRFNPRSRMYSDKVIGDIITAKNWEGILTACGFTGIVPNSDIYFGPGNAVIGVLKVMKITLVESDTGNYNIGMLRMLTLNDNIPVAVRRGGAPVPPALRPGTIATTVHDKVSSFEIHIRKKTLPLPAYVLTGALGEIHLSALERRLPPNLDVVMSSCSLEYERIEWRHACRPGLSPLRVIHATSCLCYRVPPARCALRFPSLCGARSTLATGPEHRAYLQHSYGLLAAGVTHGPVMHHLSRQQPGRRPQTKTIDT